MTRTNFLASVAVVALTMSCSPSVHAQWGDLTGTFVFDGTPPSPSAINVTKDVEFCGKHPLINEDLVVDPQSKGIANIVVYLYLGRRDPKPKVHPDYAETASATVRLDNDKCRFEPHVALVRTTQTLMLGNLDTVGHNTKIDTFANAPINPIIPAGASIAQQLTAPERLPSQVSCSIHPWMKAWIVVKEDPYMAVSDEQGKFAIKNLPAGKWTFQAWQEKSGYVQAVKLNGKNTKWSKGRFEVTIKAGANDLGAVAVSPANFDK